jgi:hypothetical protein
VEEEKESTELKGLFWLFLLSNSLTINTTFFVNGLIENLDNKNDYYIRLNFYYSTFFMLFIVLFTASFFNDIAVFICKISKEEDEDSEIIRPQSNSLNQNLA